jgi:hypothetical protein
LTLCWPEIGENLKGKFDSKVLGRASSFPWGEFGRFYSRRGPQPWNQVGKQLNKAKPLGSGQGGYTEKYSPPWRQKISVDFLSEKGEYKKEENVGKKTKKEERKGKNWR